MELRKGDILTPEGIELRGFRISIRAYRRQRFLHRAKHASTISYRDVSCIMYCIARPLYPFTGTECPSPGIVVWGIDR